MEPNPNAFPRSVEVENGKLRCKGVWRKSFGRLQIAAESRFAESKIGSTLYSNKSSTLLRITTIVRNVNIVIVIIAFKSDIIGMVMVINIQTVKKWSPLCSGKSLGRPVIPSLALTSFAAKFYD